MKEETKENTTTCRKRNAENVRTANNSNKRNIAADIRISNYKSKIEKEIKMNQELKLNKLVGYVSH
uniref:Uncharacterized protein n=1 Tax=Glossina morsitans morsitans TaxID=37546 RepID=A0A1B0FQU9_GLOMM